MKTREFLNALRQEEIRDAIRAAELRTSGEIRVFISRKSVPDPVPAAETEFLRMGMERTSERNGVLIFVAPRSNTFAVIGDEGIHKKCGPDFWEQLAVSMTGDFREGNFTAGILQAVRKAGELLGVHFPRTAADRNELADDVAQD